jgi:3-hydroxybutyrate dehydrogenase
MLKGKTALVTGSTSGIGLGIAKALARQGANIVLNGFGDVDGPKAEIAALGVKVTYHGADMSKPAEIEDMMVRRRAVSAAWTSWSTTPASSMWRMSRTSPSSAGTPSSPSTCPAPSMPPAWRCRPCAANWGRIINVASVHGLVASAQKSAYVAAKHGIVGLTKVTALENATTGVTCNAICPGWVLTPLVQKQVDAKAAAWASGPTTRPRPSCWAKKNPRCSSPRPKSWANWPSSSARPPATTCAAWPGTWTAAGSRNEPGSVRYRRQ